MRKIGEDRSERLNIVPAPLLKMGTVRPKYACSTCTEGVTEAPAPSHLITGGLPSKATRAHVLVRKYGDRLPLYRQSQLLARAGFDLHRPVLADWTGKASFNPKPVVARLAGQLKQSGKLFMTSGQYAAHVPAGKETKPALWCWIGSAARQKPGTSGRLPAIANGHSQSRLDDCLPGNFSPSQQAVGYPSRPLATRRF